MTFNIPDDCIRIDDGLQTFLAARFGRDSVPDCATDEFKAFCDGRPDDVANYLDQMKRGGLHTTVIASDGVRVPTGSDPLPNVIWNELKFEQLMYDSSIANDAIGGLEPFCGGMVCVEKQRYFEWLERDTRDYFFGAVGNGKIKPDSADQLLAAAGFQPLYVAPNANEFYPQNQPYWTLAMAVAWMIWRTSGAVTKVWEPFVSECRYWRESLGPGQLRPGFILEQPSPRSLPWLMLGEATDTLSDEDSAFMTVKEARDTLWRTLQEPSNGLSATAIRDGKRIEIPSIEWQDLELQIHGHSHAERDTLGTNHQRDIYGQVTLPRVKVQELWGTAPASELLANVGSHEALKAKTFSRPNAKSGSKLKTAKLAIGTIWPDAIPETLSAKERDARILCWCKSNQHSPPSERTIRTALAQIGKERQLPAFANNRQSG